MEEVGGAAVRNFLYGEGYQANSEERQYFRRVLLIILASTRWKENRSMPAKAPPQAEMLFPPVIIAARYLGVVPKRCNKTVLNTLEAVW